MSSLFGGSGAQTQTGGSSSTANVNYAPWYESYAKDLLARGQELAKTPFQPYDVSKMFAPFQPDQLQAFQQVRQNQGAYAPYMGAATGALGGVSNYDPYQTGMPFIQAAARSPTGYQAGSPYMRNAAQTWNPQAQAQYTNPFLQGSVNYANDLARQNFLEKTLPGVNAQFVRSGGGLGGSNYARFMNRALRDFETTQVGQAQTAAANNYWQGANQFQNDMNRQLQVGQGLGGLATGTQSTLGQLGQTASGITSGAVNTGVGLANAYSNLGGALSNLNLTNTNALLQAGNQQQQQAQNPLTAAYQQYQQGVQFPYNQLSWLSNLSSGLRIPSTQQTNTQNWQTTSGGNSPSILGGIIGGASQILGIGNVSKWLGGKLGDLFSGGYSGGTPEGLSTYGSPAPFPATTTYGGPKKRGGPIRAYASGGNVLSATGDLGGVPGGALGNVRQRDEEETKPKEPSASEAWSRSGMDANTSAPGYADGGQIASNTFGFGGGNPFASAQALYADFMRNNPQAQSTLPPNGGATPSYANMDSFGGGYGGGLGALSGGMSFGAGPFAGGMQPIAQFPQMGGYGMFRAPRMRGYGMPQMGGMQPMPQMPVSQATPRDALGRRGYGTVFTGGQPNMGFGPLTQMGGFAPPSSMTQTDALGSFGGVPQKFNIMSDDTGMVGPTGPALTQAQSDALKPQMARRGGAIRRFSQGGTVPVVRGINNRAAPALAMAAQNQRPPVPMPRPSSGALARAAAPMMRGALSAVR